jgi:hypothetical protein
VNEGTSDDTVDSKKLDIVWLGVALAAVEVLLGSELGKSLGMLLLSSRLANNFVGVSVTGMRLGMTEEMVCGDGETQSTGGLLDMLQICDSIQSRTDESLEYTAGRSKIPHSETNETIPT